MASVPTILTAALGAASSANRALFELWVGPFTGNDLTVVSFTGRERISKPFSFEIRVLADPSADLIEAALVGLPATFSMQMSAGSPRVVQGIVASIRPEGISTQKGQRPHVIRLVPRLWSLKRRTMSRVFQDLTVPEIVKQILDAANVPSSSKLSRAYAKRAYCIQHEESDYAFIARILAEEGIFWYFEQPAIDSDVAALVETVVFLDTAQGYPAIPGGDALGVDVSLDVSLGAGGISASASVGDGQSLVLPLRDGGSSGRAGSDEVTRFALDHSLRSNAVLLRDYDFTRPHLDLRAEATADDSPGTSASASAGGAASAIAGAIASAAGLSTGALQVYDHRGEFDGMEVSEARATLHLEQHRARLQVGAGRSTCASFSPGYRFQLDAAAALNLKGEYALTSVLHEGHTPEHTTHSAASEHGQQTYENTFECVPASIPARPKRPKRRVMGGLESAVVVGPKGEDIYTDEHGRVKVQFHWDLDGQSNEASSCWIRVVQTWAGPSWGSQFIPRIGMEVMVSFLGGDQDCPVVTGCVYNATHPAPFMLPAQKTRSGFRTQTTPGGGGSNELSFEDAKGTEQVYLHAQRDLDEVVDRNHTLLVKASETLRVQGARASTVEGDQIETLNAHASRSVAKDETVRVEGNRVDVVSGNADLRVAGALTTRIGKERREVTDRADASFADDYTVRVKGCYTTIVGKNDAKRSYVLRVEGTTQLSCSGVMELDAEKGLTLKCGKSFIKISADKIEIVAPSVSAKGDGGGIVADDSIAIRAKKDILIASEKILLKTPDASASWKKDVQIAGKQILLNSPDQATDPVVDTSPPPTKIAMKDQSGKPLAYQRFLIKLADGSEFSGILDGEGKTEMVIDGSGAITFPDLAKPS